MSETSDLLIYEQLKKPFEEKDLFWRLQRSGIRNSNPWAVALTYVDARAIMTRLDETVGMSNWHDSYTHLPNGVMCSLTINGVTKQDGSPETQVEAFKGGISKAFVRAAVKFGIGRYLYDIPETFVKCSLQKQQGWEYAKTKDGIFYWEKPKLDKRFLPEDKNPGVKEEGFEPALYRIPYGPLANTQLKQLDHVTLKELHDEWKNKNSDNPKIKEAVAAMSQYLQDAEILSR